MYADIMSHMNLKPSWQHNSHKSQKEVHFFDQAKNIKRIAEGNLREWVGHLDTHSAACSTTGFELDREMAQKGDSFNPDESDTKFKIIDATPNYFYSEVRSAATRMHSDVLSPTRALAFARVER